MWKNPTLHKPSSASFISPKSQPVGRTRRRRSSWTSSLGVGGWQGLPQKTRAVVKEESSIVNQKGTQLIEVWAGSGPSAGKLGSHLRIGSGKNGCQSFWVVKRMGGIMGERKALVHLQRLEKWAKETWRIQCHGLWENFENRKRINGCKEFWELLPFAIMG